MILDGEAGIGKSHLLADVVNERILENSNSIFLLGQHLEKVKILGVKYLICLI